MPQLPELKSVLSYPQIICTNWPLTWKYFETYLDFISEKGVTRAQAWEKQPRVTDDPSQFLTVVAQPLLVLS